MGWSSDEGVPGINYNSEITRNIVHAARYQCKARDMIHTRNGWSQLFNQLHHLFNMSISFAIYIFVYSCGFDDTHQLALRDYIFSRNYQIYLMARFTNSPMFLFPYILSR
jgi:hypothetical protein